MKLKYCLTNGYIHLYPTMYMFAQNSIKKIALVISTLQMRYYLYLLLPSLHLRFSFALNPFQIRSIVESRMGGRWESHGTYMGGRREEEGRKKGFPEELIAFGVYALPSILAIFILSF